MATRVIVGLTVLVAIILAVAPDANAGNALTIVLVLLGLAYPVVGINVEDATGFLVFVLVVGAAAGADVLSNIPAIGTYLDGIVDGMSTSLYAAIATVLAIRATNRIKG